MNHSTLLALSVVLCNQTVWADEMSHGKYIAVLGDCVACHTTDVNKPLAGGMAFPTPVGDVYSTNITPDKTHGIGNYTLDEFRRVMREGVAKDGHRLYPAMPYTAYAKMNDSDLDALYQYLMQDVQPQAVANLEADISWPLNMRWPLAIWNFLFHDDSEFKPVTDQSEEWNRGAYLVQGLAHCGTCHTPRGFFMQEKAYSEASPDFLAGSTLAGWYAGDIRGKNYSTDEMVALLKTGRSHHQAVSGPMGEVITFSSQYFTDADVRSIASYLADLPAAAAPAPLPKATATAQAQDDYKMYCGTCHGRDGKGRQNVVPALAGNDTVLAPDPSSLINVMLHGGHTAITQTHIGYDMPGYAWVFDDQRLAELANTLRASWGNQAGVVTAQQVAVQRSERN